MTIVARGRKRQERLVWGWIASLLLVAGVCISLLIWMLIPHNPLFQLETAAFPPSDVPYRITAQEKNVPYFWLVNTGDELLAFDRRTPFRFGASPCHYSWTPANGRFEDPCSGSKFALDGTLLEDPAVRELVTYPITHNRDGTITVHLEAEIPNAHFPPPAENGEPSK